jgi:hypothetical protein
MSHHQPPENLKEKKKEKIPTSTRTFLGQSQSTSNTNSQSSVKRNLQSMLPLPPPSLPPAQFLKTVTISEYENSRLKYPTLSHADNAGKQTKISHKSKNNNMHKKLYLLTLFLEYPLLLLSSTSPPRPIILLSNLNTKFFNATVSFILQLQCILQMYMMI